MASTQRRNRSPAHPPELLVYMEEMPNQSEACKREYEIKQCSKQEKEELVGE
jgi:putative endonuclease